MAPSPEQSKRQLQKTGKSSAISGSNNNESELRVAQSELNYCGRTTSGKVFQRLSKGAVAFRVKRSEAKNEISSKLRKQLLSRE